MPSGVYFLSWGRRPPAGPRTRPPFHSLGSQGLLLQCHGSFLCPPCSSGRGSLGGVVISAGEESRERIHHSSRPETCLGFEYTHWGLFEKRGEPWTDAMEGPCCQRSASDSTQDRLGQPDSHRSSTDGNTDMTSIISQLKHEAKRHWLPHGLGLVRPPSSLDGRFLCVGTQRAPLRTASLPGSRNVAPAASHGISRQLGLCCSVRTLRGI